MLSENGKPLRAICGHHVDRVVVLFYLSIISQDRHLRLLTPQGQIGLTDWDSDSPSCHDFPTSISRTSLPAFLVEHKHEEKDARDPAKLDEANSGSLTNRLARVQLLVRRKSMMLCPDSY